MESLVELGYAGTTTSEVQKRAGVSRGALLHHFPSRAALLADAVRYLAEMRSQDPRWNPASSARSADRVGRTIDLLWSSFHGPLFWAAMELWIASRTDPELRQVLLPQERLLGGLSRQWCDEQFGPDIVSRPHYEDFRNTLLAAMRGEALARALLPLTDRNQRHLQNWKELGRAVLAAE